jgi:hypothetical protein
LSPAGSRLELYSAIRRDARNRIDAIRKAQDAGWL